MLPLRCSINFGMLSKSNPIYKYFRKKEIRLYNISDYIGCMSPANVEYIMLRGMKYVKNMDYLSIDRYSSTAGISENHRA